MYMEDANVNEFRRIVLSGEFASIQDPIKKLLSNNEEQIKVIEYQIFE